MTDEPDNLADTSSPGRIHYAIPDFADDVDILMFDENGPRPDNEAFEPENQWAQSSIDISGAQYDKHLPQDLPVPEESESPIFPPSETFIERWGGSCMAMEDVVWAMQTKNMNFPEYQPHLHYSRESSLHGALGEIVYRHLLHM
jgi:hypothetical protein